MATRKKKSSRRRKNNSTIKVRVNGVQKNYKKSSCHDSKGAARAKAVSIREEGTAARVLKSGTRWCVYKGPKLKARKKKGA